MNKTKSILIFVLLSLLSMLAGCTSSVGSSIGTVYQIGGPVKEAEVLGLVYVKCENGEPVYQALLRAAEKKGGNGIANVVIDTEDKITYLFGLNLGGQSIKYATALAIKYTNENIISQVPSKDGKLGIPSDKTSP
ncbi:MAG: hypothetical protein LBC64_06505 [Fibromonadaceae bacterium]|jgi:hypothetical protein|nr:hypothetical protein [Fibromonadaceae bacterium]